MVTLDARAEGNLGQRFSLAACSSRVAIRRRRSKNSFALEAIAEENLGLPLRRVLFKHQRLKYRANGCGRKNDLDSRVKRQALLRHRINVSFFVGH
jgi:hypothetical protein